MEVALGKTVVEKLSAAVMKEDGVAGESALVGEVLGDHGLANTVGSEEDQVSVLLDEVEG